MGWQPLVWLHDRFLGFLGGHGCIDIGEMILMPTSSTTLPIWRPLLCASGIRVSTPLTWGFPGVCPVLGGLLSDVWKPQAIGLEGD
jgi:hypothetical protein